MENATKALMMAGGILLSMLVIALVVFARSKISDVYRQDEELAEKSGKETFQDELCWTS